MNRLENIKPSLDITQPNTHSFQHPPKTDLEQAAVLPVLLCHLSGDWPSRGRAQSQCSKQNTGHRKSGSSLEPRNHQEKEKHSKKYKTTPQNNHEKRVKMGKKRRQRKRQRGINSHRVFLVTMNLRKFQKLFVSNRYHVNSSYLAPTGLEPTP